MLGFVVLTVFIGVAYFALRFIAPAGLVPNQDIITDVMGITWVGCNGIIIFTGVARFLMANFEKAIGALPRLDLKSSAFHQTLGLSCIGLSVVIGVADSINTWPVAQNLSSDSTGMVFWAIRLVLIALASICGGAFVFFRKHNDVAMKRLCLSIGLAATLLSGIFSAVAPNAQAMHAQVVSNAAKNYIKETSGVVTANALVMDVLEGSNRITKSDLNLNTKSAEQADLAKDRYDKGVQIRVTDSEIFGSFWVAKAIYSVTGFVIAGMCFMLSSIGFSLILASMREAVQRTGSALNRASDNENTRPGSVEPEQVNDPENIPESLPAELIEQYIVKAVQQRELVEATARKIRRAIDLYKPADWPGIGLGRAKGFIPFATKAIEKQSNVLPFMNR